MQLSSMARLLAGTLSVSALSAHTLADAGLTVETSLTNESAAETAPEPATEDAVRLAVAEYAAARRSGDQEGLAKRAHSAIVLRHLESTYRGKPSVTWVRTATHEQLPLEPAASAEPEITVYDVESITASAMLHADGHAEFLHLGRLDGVWMVTDAAVVRGDAADAGREDAINAVRRVSRDYCVGFYETNGKKVQRTCHPSLSKRSIEHAEAHGYDYLQGISWEEIEVLGETFNTDWGFEPTARAEIEVYDVRGNVAAAKMTGAVWFDYFHLMEVEGKWKVVNIVFEPLPRDRWIDVG